MATYTFDFRKLKPATGGGRQDYIKPGRYKFKVVEYSDKASSTGKAMHAYTYQVSSGTEADKKIIDRFPMPNPGDNVFPMEKFLAFLEACGAKAAGKRFKLDPSKLKSKTFVADVVDERQDARTVNGTTYPARTTSAINKYVIPGVNDDEESDEDEDEDNDADDDDEDEEEDDEDEDEDEEPATAKTAAPKKRAKARAKADDDDDEDDDDFPF